MACELASAFFCTSIDNLRVAEDAIAAILISFVIGLILIAIFKLVREGPLVSRLWGFVIGLSPLLAWKLLGIIRRIFISESSIIFQPLVTFGEVLESLSAVFLLLSLVYFYLLIRPKKAVMPKSKKLK